MNLGGKIMKKFISVLCAVTLVCCGLFLSCDNGNGGEPEAPNEAGGADVVVNAIWTLNGGENTINALPADKYTGSVAISEPIVIECDDNGEGATFTLLANTDNKPKYNTGIQQNTGTKTWEFASISVDAACTITLTAKPAGDFNATKKRSVTLGDQTWTMAEDSSKDEFDLIYKAPGSGTITITAGDYVKFSSQF